MKRKLNFIALIVVTLIALSQTVDYCKKELCKKYSSGRGYYYANHIACNNNGDFSSACPQDRSLVPITQERINLLLQLHNGFRSDIAHGKIKGYKQADQMIEMEWDYELARFAELNAKTCVFKHDECRSTEKYPSPGQNIAITWSTSEYDDVDFNLVNATTRWFVEHKLGDMSYIYKYRRTIKKIGHFIQLATAGADRVGCAMTKYDNGVKKNMILVCDYSVGTILNEQIYTTGIPCSKCISGCSKSYPGLCNSNEKDYWDNKI